MNKLIQELAEQAGFYVANGKIYIPSTSEEITTCQKKFAELIVQECAQQCWTVSELESKGFVVSECAKKIRKHFGVEE